jgi:Na+/H+ antiporter NhaC
MRLAAAIGTAQKGSQALICSLIFAMGAFSVAGVVALGSSVITILILGIVAAEIGKRNRAASTSDSAKTPADQRAER